MTQVIEASEIVAKLDLIQTDIHAIKISQARTEEQLKSVDQRISDLDKSLNKRIDTLEQRGNGQETRFWGLVAILSTALLGVLGKVLLFPVDKL